MAKRTIIDLRGKITPVQEIGSRIITKPKLIQREKISWVGPLFYHYPDPRLIWVVSISMFAIATFSQIFQKNFISTVFFGLLGLTILIHARKKAPLGEFEISAVGIKINEQLHGFREIKSFWIDYQPEYGINELSLQIKKWYLPYVKIPLVNQNPVPIRSFLIQFIPEIEHQETLADAVGRRLGL